MIPCTSQYQKFLKLLLAKDQLIPRNTASSATEALQFLTSGYAEDPVKTLKEGLIGARSKSPVMLQNLKFFSLCAHHMLPFYGTATIVYVPKKHIVGLGKIPKALTALSHRLQLQEQLTEQMANAVFKALQPESCAVILDGFHFCLAMRGAQEKEARLTTLALRGKWKKNPGSFKNLAKILK